MPADVARRPGLAATQRWMQAVVTSLDDVPAGLRSREARRELAPEDLATLVTPSPALSSAERLGVYQGMYFLRLSDALEVDYPVTRHFLGRHGWVELIRAYLAAHPSRSYTLNRLSDALPGFVARRRSQPERGFLADLTRLEQAIAAVFDGEPSTPLTPAAVAAVPAGAWEEARLVPIAAFRLLDLAYPANDYLHAVKQERRPPPRRRRPNRLAVYRQGYDVYRLPLTRDGFALLSLLAAGVPLGRAIARARRRHPGLGERRVFAPFRDWVSDDLFKAVETAAD